MTAVNLVGAASRHHRRSTHALRAPGIAWALTLGAAVRLLIIPLSHGWDFEVWDEATRLLVHGVNPYSFWRDLLLPYPYLPVFLYILLPLRWLALHTPIPFTVLGKLPMAIADLVVAAMLYRWVLRSGRSTRIAVLGSCLYLFNPLVLYNSAFLGRFDAVASAFLVLALTTCGWRFSLWYGLAICTKTFPLLILPGLLLGRYRRTWRELLGVIGVSLVVTVPFLLWDPRALLFNLTVLLTTHGPPLPRGLSWQYALLQVCPLGLYFRLAPAFYALMLGATLFWRNRPPLTLCALAFSFLLLIDHKIWEQYLTWPLPFLIALALIRHDIASWLLAAGMTLAALFMNEQGHPVDPLYYMRLVRYPPVLVNALLALGIIVYVVLAHRPRMTRQNLDAAELKALQ